MSWYIAQGGQRYGPYTDEEFQNWVAQGRVVDSTLVWQDGMPNWLPYSAVVGSGAAGGAGVGVAPSAGAQTAEGGPTGWGSQSQVQAGTTVEGGEEEAKTFCSQCRRYLPVSDTIQYQGRYICAECKPMFFQSLREGGAAAAVAYGAAFGALRYAGFWIRFAAMLIDGIILFVVQTGITLATVAVHSTVYVVLGTLLGLGANVCYFTIFNGRWGASVGKLACGLRVVTYDGQRITYLRAFARYWALILILIPLWALTFVGIPQLVTLAFPVTIAIAGIIIGLDSQKRALHDHICSTRVIWK